MDTGRGTSYTRAYWGWGTRGRIALGEIPNVDDGLMGAANHHAGVYLCNKPAHFAHVPQKLKYNNNNNRKTVTSRSSASSS